MTTRVTVLLSCGRHPHSGRARSSACDKRAIELALRLRNDVTAVHVGPHKPEARLDDYLAIGLPNIDHIVLDDEFDIVPALTDWLKRRQVDLVLAGTRAETGERSGLVPYLLAQALAIPIVSDVTDLHLNGRTFQVEQAAPAGARRLVCVPTPAVLTIGGAGPAPRPASFRHRKAGTISLVDTDIRVPRKAPTRFVAATRIVDQTERHPPIQARDRLAAIRDQPTSVGRVLINPDPETAASEILTFLRERHLLPSSPANRSHADD